MAHIPDSGGGGALAVSPGNLKNAAQTLRNINSNARASYQTSYNQLLNSISLLPGSLQSWAIDNLHTWNSYMQNQVFSGNEQMADAMDSAADYFALLDKSVASMFIPQS